MRSDQLSHDVLACFYFVDTALQKLRAVLEAGVEFTGYMLSTRSGIPVSK